MKKQPTYDTFERTIILNDVNGVPTLIGGFLELDRTLINELLHKANTHDDLKEACEKALKELQFIRSVGGGTHNDIAGAILQLQAAIKKAVLA